MNRNPGLVIFALASLLVFFVGILLTVAPQKFWELGRWWGRLIGFTSIDVEWNSQLHLRWRITGAFLTLLAVFFLAFAIKNHSTAVDRAPSTTPPTSQTTIRLGPYTLVANVLPMLFGAYLLLGAGSIARKMAERPSSRPTPNSKIRLFKAILRTVGAVFVVTGGVDLGRALLLALR